MVTKYALKCRTHLHSPFYVIGFAGKKRFPYKKETSKFRSGRKPMLLLITIIILWLVERELACSRQLVKCGAKSETGEKNKGGGEEREIEILCSHSLPHAPRCFSCSHLFAPSPQSKLLEQAIREHVWEKPLCVECWVTCFLIRIAHKKIPSQNNQEPSYCVGLWSPLGVATPRLVSF